MSPTASLPLASGTRTERLPVFSRRQVLDQPADSADRRADSCALLPTGERTDARSAARCATDNQRLLFPRPLVRVRGFGTPCHDSGGGLHLAAGGSGAEFHGMQALFVVEIHGMRLGS